MMPPLLDHGMMAVGGGHHVYWEMAGNPKGQPALVLHGGPGSGCRPGHYDLFDLERYKVVLMDQRGAGRSKPRASASVVALTHNTTDDLLCDISALREFLGIEKWLVFGGSWGSTLALFYAQSCPDDVRALVLAGVATTAERDLEWLYGDVGNLFPEAYDGFCEMVPQAQNVTSRIAAYGDLLADSTTAQEAADAWCRWELAIFEEDLESVSGAMSDPAFRLGFARVVTHYFRHRAWREDRHIARNMDKIAHIPGVMIHSRFDPSCPLRSPWELSKLWPAARLEILGKNDHSALSDPMKVRIRSATDAFAFNLS